MEKNPQKKKIMRFILTLLVLTIIFGALLTLFGFLIKSQVQTVSKQRSELKALQEKEKNLKELSQQYQKVAEETEKILAMLPTQNNFLQFVSFLEGKAAENGLGITLEFPEGKEAQKKSTATNVGSTAANASAQRTAEPAGSAGASQAPAQSSTTQQTQTSKTSQVPAPQTIIFSAKVAGSYSGLLSFWQALERGPYFINITVSSLELPGSFDLDGALELEGELYVDQSFTTAS